MKQRKMPVVDRIILPALLVGVVLAVGCASLQSSKLQIGVNDNGRRIEMRKGQDLILSLESNPTTGYQWEKVACQETVLRQMGEATFQPRSKNLLGAPGTQTFRFKAVNMGQADLKLTYHRPWEKNVAPAKTFTVRVVVR